MGEYKIGATYGGAKFFSAFTTPMVDPRGSPIEYAEVIPLGNGKNLGVGWQKQTWHWASLTETQVEQVRALIGVVYVNIRLNTGSFGWFTGELVWPEREPEHDSNRELDLTVEIRKLVTYSP